MNNNLENTFYDIIVIGCGLSGICLVLELCKRTKKKILILEKKKKLINDKNWCFWNHPLNEFTHNSDHSWKNIKISFDNEVIIKNDVKFSYNNIPSIKLYGKIIEKVKDHSNLDILFNQDITELIEDKDLVQIESNKRRYKSKFVFDSRPPKLKSDGLIQHFLGVEYLFDEKVFNKKEVTLMDFQKNENVIHFFYILPFTEKKALIETTWLSDLEDQNLMNYDLQLEDYIKNNLKIKNYKVKFVEKGAIPLFYPPKNKNDKVIDIGAAGEMTRLSTGYTFLNIQEHSKYILKNIDRIEEIKKYNLGQKYKFLDKIFLKVLKNNPEKMPNIFYKMFKCSPCTVIKFLSNKSNILEDINIISKMPKLIFLKELFY